MADHTAVASPIDAASTDMAQSSLEHRVVQYTDGWQPSQMSLWSRLCVPGKRNGTRAGTRDQRRGPLLGVISLGYGLPYYYMCYVTMLALLRLHYRTIPGKGLEI